MLNSTEVKTPIEEIDLLWLTAALGCDGDTIAMTTEMQPTIEDLLGGVIPGLPRINLRNPFLSRENGDEFIAFFERGAHGIGNPFLLIVDCSIPNEHNKSEGYWASFGSDKTTGQPIKTCDWNQSAGSMLSSQAIQTYGHAIRALRSLTQASVNKEPKWRTFAKVLLVTPNWCHPRKEKLTHASRVER